MKEQDRLLELIRSGEKMTRRQKIRLALMLSMPAMLAQIGTIVMEYIDASMVGSMGAAASAAIGLVSTTTWLFGSVSHSVSTGFYVQVAHLLGGSNPTAARRVLRQGITTCMLFGLLLMLIGCAISNSLPVWLGGSREIIDDAAKYFLMFSIALPFIQLNSLAGGMLRCSGNMKIPSLLSVLSCFIDVIANYVFIFILNMGVLGAALGTLIAIVTTALLMFGILIWKSKDLNLLQDSGSFRPTRDVMKEGLHIALPIGVEHLVMCGAQIMSTIIVAPLGTIAIAANSFGIIVESLCYMPGYGIAEAATTLVGQSLGARRKDLCRSFANITVALGIGVMSLMAVVMFFGSPFLMPLMTPDPYVQQLTVDILRIEAFAEPMFAASIVTYGVFVGAGDTLIPCTMNLTSIWVIRITTAALLAPVCGLQGVWIAMAFELTFRGIMFLTRLRTYSWTFQMRRTLPSIGKTFSKHFRKRKRK